MGRPKGDKPPRIVTAVRLAPDAVRYLDARANARGMTRGAYMRQLLSWAISHPGAPK